MRMTKEGLDLIREFEGCALVAYQDQGGRWTLGWGRARDIREGDTCDADQANAWLMQDLEAFEDVVLRCVSPKIANELNDNQLSALVSFVFNVGLGHPGVKDGFQLLYTGEPSTMLKCLLAGDFQGAAAEFPKWDKVGGTASPGLLRRRLAEQALFLKPVS